MSAIYDNHTNMLSLFSHPVRYERLTNRVFGRLYRRIAADVAAAGLAPGSRVLDVGTGPGRVPLAIAAVAGQLAVDGLDVSPTMIEHARHAAEDAGLADRVGFIVGDVADLPYPENSFDLIVSSMSQHHWSNPRAGLRELHRVLRPGAQVWIYDARLALPRATAAARAAFPAPAVRREPVRMGRLPITFTGRLIAQRPA
jgi:ubiquinone/menaquinone biosynthesis C-methylase UbiE